LVSAPLTYPAAHLALPSLSDLLAQVQSPTTLCVPLNPAAYAGALWAVPLWSERGVIGLFLLGEKSDGGLYAQEEIEMARASGERLLDAQASAELAARLMSLQRQRLAESQVLDRRARRILHDEVLPQLHTAMLALGSQEDEGRRTKDESQKRENCSSQPGLPSPLGRAAVGNALGSAQGEDTGPSLHSSSFVLRPESALDLLTDVHRQLSNLLREMPTTAAPEVARLGLLGALRKLVEEEFAGTFEQVTWQIADSAAQNVAAIPSLPAEVVFYAAREGIRNASRHARPSYSTQPLHLTVTAAWQAGLQLVIADDGMGLSNGERENGTGGQGLALHSTMMAVVGGTLTVDSAPGSGVRVVLLLPMVGGGVS